MTSQDCATQVITFYLPIRAPCGFNIFLCICEREDVRYVLCTSASVDHAILFFGC